MMRMRLAVLIASLALSPVVAEAAACKLEHATFRPKYAPELICDGFPASLGGPPDRSMV